MNHFDLSPARFENLPKDTRRRKAEEEGILEGKRFLASYDSEMQHELRMVRRIIQVLSKLYPEVKAVTLSGSRVKGYASKTSDIDGYLFIDQDQLQNASIPTVGLDPIQIRMNRQYIIMKVLDRLVEIAGIKSTKWRISGPLPLSEEVLVKACQNDEADRYFLPRLFHLSIGNLEPYRKIVLSTLEAMGPEGEERWKNIAQYLWKLENFGFSPDFAEERRKLYPFTLSEAKRYFCQ